MSVKIQFILAIFVLLTNFSVIMNAQTKQTENQDLTAKQKSIVTVSALTARGDLKNLRTALNQGLDAKLTVNEIKEIFVQLYAYCGFSRSLNGISSD